MKPAALHARLAAGTEISGSLSLTLGASSSLPAAVTIGLMTVAARTDHWGEVLLT